jgi:hypothetical protein
LRFDEVESLLTPKKVGAILAIVKKRRVCIKIDESLVKELEQVREKTGIPVSIQVELLSKVSRFPTYKRKKQGQNLGTVFNM